MFQLLDCQYNKQVKRLNKVLRKLQKHYLWEHGPGLINHDVTDAKDRVYLKKSAERLFASSIADTLSYHAKNY